MSLSCVVAPALQRAAQMTRCFALCLIAAATACTGPADEELAVEDLLLSADARPPFHGRFGSPTIVRDGDKLHAYFAIQTFEGERVNVTHARSDDNGRTWLRIGEALPRLNAL